MAENRFVMVSEWMESGNIKEFVSAHTDANRLDLVCFFRALILFVTDNLIAVAQRRHQGVGIHA